MKKGFLDIVKKERGDSNYMGDQHGGAAGSAGSGLPDGYARIRRFSTGACGATSLPNAGITRICKKI
jgi:hypothetical protein